MSKSKRKIIMGYDPASKKGDYNCIVCSYVDSKGILHIEELKGYKRKEIRKMSRPYFEMKVVKVKKEKPFSKLVKCGLCGDVHECTCGLPEEKKKGNWINGENLDKIKFPCFCRWNNNQWFGMIIHAHYKGKNAYTLVRIDEQTKENHTYGYSESLKNLFKGTDIHILKGKIIIFEEER